jgi:RNA polymerase sigma-70 factor (ECF subfamily)
VARRWLYRIATNEINAHLRQSIRRRELLIAAAKVGRIDADISTQLLDREAVADWEAVYRAMEQLTERENKIVSLRFFGELKHDEIASVLEAKPGTIRVALSRALEKMRGLLLKSLDESVATKSSKLGNEQ